MTTTEQDRIDAESHRKFDFLMRVMLARSAEIAAHRSVEDELKRAREAGCTGEEISMALLSCNRNAMS